MIEDLEEYLKNEARLCYSQLVDLITNEPSRDKRSKFLDICKEIIDKGGYTYNKDLTTEVKDIISQYAEKEIFFFDPVTLRVTGNNRLYEKGMEILIKDS